jgi:hypothetical protein
MVGQFEFMSIFHRGMQPGSGQRYEAFGADAPPSRKERMALIRRAIGGGAPAIMATVRPPENEFGYPEATMFGDLPTSGLFLHHVRNVSLSYIEVQAVAPDPRPACWVEDAAGVDAFRIRAPGKLLALRNFSHVRISGSGDARMDKMLGDGSAADL